MSSKKKSGNSSAEPGLAVEDCVNMIRSWLSAQKIDKDVCAGQLAEDETLMGWVVPFGPVCVNIYLLGLKSDKPYFLIESGVASLPDTGILPFYRRCLELNSELVGASTKAEDKGIFLTTKRFIEDLSPDDVFFKMRMMFEQAPAIAKVLHSEFDTSPPLPD